MRESQRERVQPGSAKAQAQDRNKALFVELENPIFCKMLLFLIDENNMCVKATKLTAKLLINLD
jgi:hypothetical protein